LRVLLASAKRRARTARWAFDIGDDDESLDALWNDGRCAVTGRKFSLQRFPDALVKHPFAPSLDRKLSSGAYTADNVRLVCVAVNFGMGQWGEEVYLELAHAAVQKESKGVDVGPNVDWQVAYRERIAAAEAVLAGLPEPERAKQRQRIAGLKSALAKGPRGLKAAAAKAKASRKRSSRPGGSAA
jgi:hypothetical protein